MMKKYEKSKETGKKIGKKSRKKCIDDPMKCGSELGLNKCKFKDEKQCNEEVFKKQADCLIYPRDCAKDIAKKECYKKYPANKNFERNNCVCNAMKKINPENTSIIKEEKPCQLVRQEIKEKDIEISSKQKEYYRALESEQKQSHAIVESMIKKKGRK